MKNRLKQLGIEIPEVLLPAKHVELESWSVVACDQYTSQPEYWDKVEKDVGDKLSALHLVFPEIYLEETGKEEKIKKIYKTMKEYLSEKYLAVQSPGFIYIDRKTSHTASRKGLIIAVDLEKYDYNKGSQALIRATEGTVIERLPPRIKIRENASIEVPHIMLLIDDAEKTVIEPLVKKLHKLEKLYDFDLMMDGGHIKGYKIEDEETIADILMAFERLAEPDAFKSRYGTGEDKDVLLFAVGDGNHSLAAAKAHWENIKSTLSEEEKCTHPSRFALVEVVNVHDDGLSFEPIHRVVFNISPQEMINEMFKYFNVGSSQAYIKILDTKESVSIEVEEVRKSSKSCHIISFIAQDIIGYIAIEAPKCTLEVGTLQLFLDQYVKTDTNIKIDYIHGEDVVASLGSKEGNIGFYLPSMNKHDLFKTVIFDGVLPRKTFSMGEPEEKRFYLECRSIT